MGVQFVTSGLARLYTQPHSSSVIVDEPEREVEPSKANIMVFRVILSSRSETVQDL